MRKGKILTNPLIRSVLRHPFPQKEERELARDGAVICADGAPAGSSVSTTVYGGPMKEALAFYRSLNAALAAGIIPETLLLALTLPPDYPEQALSACIGHFQRLAEREKTALSGGHTTVSENVCLPILTAVISGRFDAEYTPGKQEGQNPSAVSGSQSSLDLVMTGFAGECGAGILLASCREKLLARFSPAFLEEAELREERLSVRAAAEILRAEGADMHSISEGGVFSALYTFAEGHGTGFEADLRAIPIRQETVEICNFLDVNPYELLSAGALLASVRDGKAAAEKLRDAGIPASVIGRTVPGKQKILLRGEEKRYLERPKQDPVMRLPDFG